MRCSRGCRECTEKMNYTCARASRQIKLLEVNYYVHPPYLSTARATRLCSHKPPVPRPFTSASYSPSAAPHCLLLLLAASLPLINTSIPFPLTPSLESLLRLVQVLAPRISTNPAAAPPFPPSLPGPFLCPRIPMHAPSSMYNGRLTTTKPKRSFVAVSRPISAWQLSSRRAASIAPSRLPVNHSKLSNIMRF